MRRKLLALSRRYLVALQRHLKPGEVRHPSSARRLGQAAVARGFGIRDLAHIHESAVTTLVLKSRPAATRRRTIRQAEVFLAEVSLAIEDTLGTGMGSSTRLNQQNKTFARRTAQLAAANHGLEQGILQRKGATLALRKKGRQNSKLLRKSHQIQKHLRDLTRRLLLAQEAERTRISHELQDEVAQTLLGINVRLLALKTAATGSAAGLTKAIASTQRVLKKSVRSINRFALELGIHEPA